jgi:hypothetical protein
MRVNNLTNSEFGKPVCPWARNAVPAGGGKRVLVCHMFGCRYLHLPKARQRKKSKSLTTAKGMELASGESKAMSR